MILILIFNEKLEFVRSEVFNRKIMMRRDFVIFYFENNKIGNAYRR